MRKTIAVEFDDPAIAPLILTLEGNVHSPLDVDPRRVYFGAVEIGESAAKHVSVRVDEPETVRIVSASVEDERFSLQQTGGDSVSSILYSLTFKGAEKPENVRTWLEILYDSGGDEPKRKRVQVWADVVEHRADKPVDTKVR